MHGVYSVYLHAIRDSCGLMLMDARAFMLTYDLYISMRIKRYFFHFSRPAPLWRGYNPNKNNNIRFCCNFFCKPLELW